MSDKEQHNKKYRKGISVYACESDIKHQVILDLAQQAGLISKDRYDGFIDCWLRDIDIELNETELSDILKNFFGFNLGNYEEHLIEGVQKTRFNGEKMGEIRYIGEERTDRDWIETGLASREAKEICNYGDVLRLGE